MVFALVTSLAGCRSARDNQIDILERELRSQEDYIYELEDYIVEYSDKLQDCRCTHPPHKTVVHQKTSSPDLVDAKPLEDVDDYTVHQPTSEEPAEVPMPEPDPPKAQPLKESQPLPEDIEVPNLEFELDEPVSQRAMPQDQLEVAQAMFDEDEVDGQFIFIPDPSANEEFEMAADTLIEDPQLVEAAYEEQEEMKVYGQAKRIVITEVLRGGEREGSPQTLLTVVEARDSKNEPAELDGMVSLMVMTTDKTRPKRLRRWDFSEEETLSSWQLSHLGDGLHLELPLGEAPLPNEPVELWARLMTNDGRKLLARLPFSQSALVTIDNRPDPVDQALAEAVPLESQATELPQAVVVIEPEKPAADGPQWRASKEAAQDGRATTNGWQASQQYDTQVQQAATTSHSTKTPVWTTGRSATSKVSNSSRWSKQR